jgi:hypothetical protein
MLHRRKLRLEIRDAWSTVIANLYENQRINSERSLQAALWAALNERLPDVSRMFIEPHLKVAGCDKSFVPDIVVCSKFRIAAIIEMKYRPRGDALYSKDLRTLQTLAQCSSEDFAITNMRFEGKKVNAREYRLSPTTLLVWAGVHRPLSTTPIDRRGLLCNDYDIPKCRFMQLHAETVRGGHAVVGHLPKR